MGDASPMSTGAGGWRRAVLACGLAAICVAVLGGRVYSTFERVRVRLVKMPLMADGPSMSIELPGQSRLAGLPTALILRIQGSSEPADLTVVLDGRPVARVNVPARDEVRIDTSIGSGIGEPHALTLTATRSGWALNYLEVASLHGFAGSPLNLVIVPRDRTGDGVLPAWMLVPLLIALAWIRPQAARPAGPVRYLHLIAAGLVLLLFGVALLARMFTQYGMLLSLQTWLFCAAVLYAEPLSRLWRRVAARAVAPDVGTPSAPAFPGRREVLWAFAGLAAVIGVVLHVQVMNLDSVPDLGDPLFSIWRLSWVAHQLTTDPRHLFDANIFYPARHTLTYSDAIILPAITAMPLRWSGLHPVVVYNLLMLSAFVFSGLATYLLARCLGFGVAAAWTSAVIFSLYPFRIDHYSHLELQMSHWMPLALLFTHRVMAGRRKRFVLWTALAIGAQWYSSMYYGLFLSLYVAVFALVLAFSWKAWRRLGMVAAAVVLGAGLAWPLAWTYSQSQQERGGWPCRSDGYA